ncbi:MAG: DUF962 domain-containing protein [Flavobacteriales bacterium]|nr:DUF962 domain-containing protein [Flavobacteriales bacterium]
MPKKYTSFKEFYPHYLSEHQKTGTRLTHFVGTSAFFICILLALVYGPWYLWITGIILAYGCAWIGHFFIEKNKPATFQYPLWSLMGDFKLYFQILFLQESIRGTKD